MRNAKPAANGNGRPSAADAGCWERWPRVLALAAVVAIGLTIYSFDQRRQTLEAYSLSVTANAREALRDGDTVSALSLALAATQMHDPPLAARQMLLDAAYAPGARSRVEVETLFPGTEGPATALKISPDGRTALAGLADGSIALMQLRPEGFAASAESRILAGHTARVNDIAFSPDGNDGAFGRGRPSGDPVGPEDGRRSPAVRRPFGHRSHRGHQPGRPHARLRWLWRRCDDGAR